MSDGLSQLDEWIARLKALGGDKMPERVAELAAPLVDAEVKKTAKAGTDPLGKAWTPKKDGGRPLVNAPSHISTKAQGRVVAVTLTGPDVWHHYGRGGAPRRQVLPDGASIPKSVWDAVHKAAKQAFDELIRR